jgi:bifunctional non-homologous end joining protein LigD
MKARLESVLPHEKDWLFEVKLDGIRAVAVKDHGRVRLFSRLPRDLTPDYPVIADAVRSLPADRLVIDGELVALDDEGRSSFQLLQNRRRIGSGQRVVYYLFDLVNLSGRDLRSLPLTQRRGFLEALTRNATGPLRFSHALDAPAPKVWKEILRRGLEGVVAKRADSKYEAGRRTGAWIKVKAQQEQEFVIGGYTPPQGNRKYFGALLIGYYAGHDLIFASRVGAGFDHATLGSLYRRFQTLRIAKCPFAIWPPSRTNASRWGMSVAEMSRCLWLRPDLVCQVRFFEWTRDGNLRQPVFLGLREDRRATEVRREIPA